MPRSNPYWGIQNLCVILAYPVGSLKTLLGSKECELPELEFRGGVVKLQAHRISGHLQRELKLLLEKCGMKFEDEQLSSNLTKGRGSVSSSSEQPEIASFTELSKYPKNEAELSDAKARLRTKRVRLEDIRDVQRPGSHISAAVVDRMDRLQALLLSFEDSVKIEIQDADREWCFQQWEHLRPTLMDKSQPRNTEKKD